MNKENKQQAKDLYTQGCNMYLCLFCQKHDFYYNDTDWVGNAVGGLASVGDYFVSMETIITDIDRDAPEEEFLKWYDYCTEAVRFNLPQPNFGSWLSGCPRTSSETFQKLHGLDKDLQKLINEETEKCTSNKEA